MLTRPPIILPVMGLGLRFFVTVNIKRGSRLDGPEVERAAAVDGALRRRRAGCGLQPHAAQYGLPRVTPPVAGCRPGPTGLHGDSRKAVHVVCGLLFLLKLKSACLLREHLLAPPAQKQVIPCMRLFMSLHA